MDFMAAIGLKAAKELSAADLAYLSSLQGGNYRWPRGGKENLVTKVLLTLLAKNMSCSGFSRCGKSYFQILVLLSCREIDGEEQIHLF